MVDKLVLRDVSLAYRGAAGETAALAGVSMTVEEGEFVAVIGQSGCGKSTLLSLAAGLAAPDSGAVLLDGRPVTGPRREVGIMLQQDCLLGWRSVIENALLGAEIQGVDMPAARDRAVAMLTRYGLGGFLDHRPKQLSGGMRQRVALARTLCTGPAVLLLDEPFSALDAQTRIALGEALAAEVRQEGRTAVLVTHDIAEAIALADRVVVMARRPGRIRASHPIRFATPDGARPTPLEARSRPEFQDYFRLLWQELDLHDAG